MQNTTGDSWVWWGRVLLCELQAQQPPSHVCAGALSRVRGHGDQRGARSPQSHSGGLPANQGGSVGFFLCWGGGEGGRKRIYLDCCRHMYI